MKDFSKSARMVMLMNGRILSCGLMGVNGTYFYNELDLDDVIGNFNGELKWNGNNWSKSSRNATLEQGVLSAELKTRNGEWKSSSIDLNQYIGNSKGEFGYSINDK